MNPFSPSRIVNANLFGGRLDYTWNILKKLSNVKLGNSTSFYLHGERGIGKTSLAKLIKYVGEKKHEKLHNLNFLTSYYSVQKKQNIRSVLEASLNNITEKIPDSVINKLKNRLGNLFKNGKFQIGAFGVNVAYEKNAESIIIKDQFISIIRNIIREIVKSGDKESRDGILIIIDEMDNLEDIEIVASIIKGIKTTLEFDDLGYLSFLFIGYKNGLEKFINGDPSIARSIDQIPLIEMPNKDIIETFEKGFVKAEVKWDEKELEKQSKVTGGYPLVIQVIGYHLIDKDTNKNIELNDWQESIQESARELIDKEYSLYYSFYPKTKKNRDLILQTLAIASTMNTQLSAKEIEEVTKIKNPRQYLKESTQKGITIFNDKKKYSTREGLLAMSIILDFFQCFESQAEIKIEEIQIKIKELSVDKKIKKTKKKK